MADATTDTTKPAPAAPPAAPKVDAEAKAKADAKAARKAAKKELRAMHAMDRSEPGFDHKRFHELHYLAAGKVVPDPDDKED